MQMFLHAGGQTDRKTSLVISNHDIRFISWFSTALKETRYPKIKFVSNEKALVGE